MVYNLNNIINLSMFSKIKKVKLSSIILVLLNIVLIIFVIPSFTINIGGSEIKYPEIDGHFFYEGSTIGNVKEGRGLYPTYKVTVAPNFGETELSDDQKDTIINESVSRFSNRASNAGLYDLGIWREGNNVILEFPRYYNDVSLLAKQLVAQAKIDFISINGSPLELYDYDIDGVISQTYLPALGNHLVLNFKSDKVNLINSALSEAGSTTQGYFYMNIDNENAFFVAKTQYTSDPAATLRLIPLTQNTNTRLSLAIVKSYFEENQPFEYAFDVNTPVEEIPANFPLKTLAEQVTIGAVFIAVVLAVAYWVNRKVIAKKQFATLTLFVLSTLALLKVSSAVLSVATYFSILALLVLGVMVMSAYFRGHRLTKNLVRNLFISLLVIVIFLSPLSKNWVLYDIVGVLSASICGMIITLLLHQGLNAKKKK